MKVKTELFLHQLLWLGGSFLSPASIRTPVAFGEGGAFSNSMLRQIQRLEKQALLEKQKHEKYGQLIQLTEKGQKLLAEDDWTSRWQQNWDGFWYLVLFDIAEDDRSVRDAFRKNLNTLRFGCLQKSLWVSPFPQPALISSLKKEKPGGRHCTLMQAKELLGLNPFSIVQEAWNFKRLEEQCRAWEKALGTIEHLLQSRTSNKEDWNLALAAEFGAWQDILRTDPFLPLELQPKNYLTPGIWLRRKKLLQQSLERRTLSLQSDNKNHDR